MANGDRPDIAGPVTTGGDLPVGRGERVIHIDTGRELGVGINDAGRLVLFDPQTGRTEPGLSGRIVTANGRQLILSIDGRITDDRLLTQTEREALGLTFSDPTAPSGGLSFEQRRQLSQEERAFEAGENRIQREHELRTRLLGDVVDLQAQARALIADRLGRDPVRGGVLASGAIPIGRSDNETFLLNLRETARNPVSQTETTEQLQHRVLGGLPEEPLALAGGGTIQPGETALIGEGGPEILTFQPDGRIKVTPLSRSFEHGGEFEFDPRGRVATLAPIFEQAGFEPGITPLATRTGFGQLESPLFGDFTGLPERAPRQANETFQRLGVSPRFFQPAGSGEVFFLDPASQQLRPVEGGFAGAVNTLGIQPRDINVVSRDELNELGAFSGEALTAPPVGESAGRVPFASSASPIFSPLDISQRLGVLLPQPRLLAPLWRTLDPDTQAIVKGTYALAGFSEANFDREIEFFSRAGTGQPSARFG